MIEPSLISDAVAEQFRLLPTTMLVEGLMVAELMVGAVFSTLTLVEELAVAPLESVAVAVQVTLAPTFASDAATV